MRSIRLRLALWYAVALAAGLSVFAAALWTSTWHSLRSDVTRALIQQTHGVEAFLRAQIADVRVSLPIELDEYASALPEGIDMEVSSMNGRRLFTTTAAFPWKDARRIATEGKMLTWRGIRYRVAAHEISAAELRWNVVFAGSMQRADATVHRLLWLILAWMPAVILIACAGGVWLSRRALKPVDEITAAAREIGIEDLSKRLTVPQTGDELQRLSETWNGMLARLEDAVARLSRFTADASHELRTPLAVIRGTAEIAGRRSRSEEAYRTALASITRESERMTVLIDDLLFLARCDADSLDLPMSSLALDEVLEDVCELMRPAAETRGIALSWTNAGEAPLIWGNRSAIRRLVLILVDNAVKYSRPGGKVEIRTESRDEEIHLRVRDQGLGIPASELPFLFQRFYRGVTARDKGNNGFGLGLALASGIAQRHRSKIEVSSTSAEGSIFEVALPVSPSDPSSTGIPGRELAARRSDA